MSKKNLITLALTLNSKGGQTVAIIPADSKVTALINDGKGYILVANHFDLTGWARPTTATHVYCSGASIYAAWRVQCFRRLTGPVFAPLGH